MRRLLAVTVFVSAALWGPVCGATPPRADVCMAIGLDASGSITSSEMRLQLDGVASTLTDPRFLETIRSGIFGKLVLSVYSWSEVKVLARVLVSWTTIIDEQDALAAATTLREKPALPGSGGTGLGPAVADGAALLATCPFFADRLILNVVGDGATNIGPQSSDARDAAVGRGVLINGLVVGGDSAVMAHFRKYVIGPQGISFVQHATDFEDFAAAMLRKFVTEVAAIRLRSGC